MDENTSKFPPNSPLRLEVALKAAFPAGGLTIASLRKEIARGRLEVELIAGKHFTTLAAIERMREKCKVSPDKSPRVEIHNLTDEETERALTISRIRLKRLVETTLQKAAGKRRQKSR